MDPQRLERVAVLGMGTMGAGIAQVCAQAGLEVMVLETSDDRLDEGGRRMTAFLDDGVRRGKLSSHERDAVMSRVRGTTASADLAGTQLVLEAVVEDLAVKRAVLDDVSAVVDEDAIVATNTSAISVTELAAGVPAPGRVAGLHFFNPAPLMRLVEVVAAVRTEPATIEALEGVAHRLGKETVVTKDRPGFLVNRLLMPYLNQVVQDLDEGLAAPADLDAALELGLGYPMGPLQLLDLIGLDNHLHATGAAWEQTRDPHLVPPALLERLVAAGRLGRKSGHGFHLHSS